MRYHSHMRRMSCRYVTGRICINYLWDDTGEAEDPVTSGRAQGRWAAGGMELGGDNGMSSRNFGKLCSVAVLRFQEIKLFKMNGSIAVIMKLV